MKIDQRFPFILPLCFLFSCFVLLTSCQTIKGLLGLTNNEPPEQTTSEKSAESTDQNQPPLTATPLTLPPIDLPATGEVPADPAFQAEPSPEVAAQPETTESQTSELKVLAPQIQPFQIDAPITARIHLGGAPQFVAVDEAYVYLDFLSQLTLTSRSLTVLAKKKISAPLVEIKKYERDKKNLLFLKEEKNLFEVLELTLGSPELKGNAQLNTLLTKDFGSPFEWLNDHLIAVLSPDKIQIMNISDLNHFTIDSELALANVTDILPHGQFLYLARDQYLDILNFETLETQSTLRIGRNFTLEGLIKQAGQFLLVLAYRTSDNAVQAIQYMRLTEDGSSITDFADNIALPSPLQALQTDLVNGLIVGREAKAKGNGPLRLFSLKHKKFLRGPLDRFAKTAAWSVTQSQITVIDEALVTCSKIDLDEKVITQADSIQQIIDTKSSVPLAQVGATKIVRDEYQLTPIVSQRFANEPQRIALLDREHLVLVEENENRQQNVLTTTQLSAPETSFSTPAGAENLTISQWLTTNLGVFFYSETTRQIFYLDPDLAQLQTLPLQIDPLVGWSFFSSKRGDTLVLVTTRTPTAKQPARYQISFYRLNSPSDIPLIYSMPSLDPAFVFYIPEDQIVVLTSTKMSLYDWNNFWPEEALIEDVAPKPPTNVNPEEVVDFKDATLDILAAKISPTFDRLYALTNTPAGMTVLVFNIFDTTQKYQLKNISVSPAQFSGSSFAKAGRLFILPSDQGTIFYDMTSPVQEREITRWLSPANSTDVADQGQFICVATKVQGVYCGDLLF